MTDKIKIHDTVALTRDFAELGFCKGQVGVVVDQWDNSHFEVELVDDSGSTLGQLAASEQDLMLLHFRLRAA